MTQESYDPLDYDCFNHDPKQAHKLAKGLRDRNLRLMKQQGKQCYGWRLTGQLKKYASLGVPDGRVRTVYYISCKTYE